MELKLDPEEAIISALMIEPKSVERICGILSPEMFEKAILGRAFLEYCRFNDNGKELGLAELQSVLNAEFPDYEVEYALRECLSTQITSSEIVGTAHVLANRYKKSCVDALVNRTKFTESEVDDQISRLIVDLEKLQDGKTNSTNTVSEITEKYRDQYFIDSSKPKANIGMGEFDSLIGGFEGGDLVIVGARPAVGKSALVTQWSEIFANRGMKVGFYNLEMTDKQMYERFVAAKSGIEITRIRMATRFLNDEQERFNNANEELIKQKGIYISTGAKKVSEIRAEMRHMGYDILIIDYLQLLLADERYSGNRTAEVGEISRQLKAIAIDYNIPVIALSQLNRMSEGRQNKEPTMGELREAGNLEQDASVIVLMWNKDDDDHSKKGCKVEKSRQGKTGRCDLVFDGAHMTFKAENDITPFD